MRASQRHGQAIIMYLYDVVCTLKAPVSPASTLDKHGESYVEESFALAPSGEQNINFGSHRSKLAMDLQLWS